MMKLLEALVYQLMAGLVIGIVCGGIATVIVITTEFEPHSAIIKHECGEYNNTTGDFQWKRQKH